MSRLQEFKAELEPYKNTLVINECNKVVRLVDVIRSEGDNYWVYDGFQGITYESCVGGWIPIKGFIV